MTPRDAADLAERTAVVPMGPGDWFSGYSVLGVSFASGHTLAFRRFPASSIGPGYRSVWHRTRAGGWTFYATVRPEHACARYFGAAVDCNVLASIDVEWVAPDELQVSIADTLEWHVRLTSSVTTRRFNELGITLTGRTPNRNRCAVMPHRVWLVASSRAIWRGHDLGPCGPRRGLFVVGQEWFDRPEPRTDQTVAFGRPCTPRKG